MERSGWQGVARRIRVPMGFVVAVVFLLVAAPTPRTMTESLVLVLPGLWLRGYASGYVRKNSELTRTGPYGYTRNPLYLGSMLIAFGFAGAAGSWVIAVVLAVLFAAIYVPTIRSEEEFLSEYFPEFAEYARRVPRLLPRLRAARFEDTAPGGFSLELYRQHREYNALLGAAVVYAVLAVRLASEHNILRFNSGPLFTQPWWP
jgi:protein-S-isoprenylcysteine O-methyltransferase Ste14